MTGGELVIVGVVAAACGLLLWQFLGGDLDG